MVGLIVGQPCGIFVLHTGLYLLEFSLLHGLALL